MKKNGAKINLLFLKDGATTMSKIRNFAAAYFYFYFIGFSDKVFCCV